MQFYANVKLRKKTYGTINIKIDKVESQEKHAVSKLGWFRIRHTKDIKLSCGWFWHWLSWGHYNCVMNIFRDLNYSGTHWICH